MVHVLPQSVAPTTLSVSEPGTTEVDIEHGRRWIRASNDLRCGCANIV
jgi:hypothetical protein